MSSLTGSTTEFPWVLLIVMFAILGLCYWLGEYRTNKRNR